MQLAPLICVRDVEAASRWYQRLLGCESGHGGSHYERLNAAGRLILQLHDWNIVHHHGPLGEPDLPHGNGVLLWFELGDYEAAVQRAGSRSTSSSRAISPRTATGSSGFAIPMDMSSS